MKILDLDFTPKKFDQIVSVLKDWFEDEVIDWVEAERRLEALKIEKDEIDWLMDAVNAAYVTDVRKHLEEQIEEYQYYLQNY